MEMNSHMRFAQHLQNWFLQHYVVGGLLLSRYGLPETNTMRMLNLRHHFQER